MSDNSDTVARCKAQKVRGGQCNAPPTTGSQWCFWHDRSRKDEQRLAAVKGGLVSRAMSIPDMPTPRLRSPEDVAKLLEFLSGRVGRGEVSVHIANSIGYLARISLYCIEVEVSTRLHKLEEAMKNRGLIQVS